MKNRDYKKLLTIAAAVALIVGSLGTTSLPAFAEKTTVQSSIKTDSAESVNSVNTATAAPYKSETVYVKTTEDGKVSSIIVSDQLKNIDNTNKLKDISILENIENVKGEETFSKEQDTLTWDTDKKDICYQGTTKKELPVSFKTTYTLDGKTISAAALKGKSGHLVVRYQYENKTATEKDYVPFLMVTGLVYDTDKVTNITVTNGKIHSDGDRDIIIGMGLPSLNEQLDVKDLDIPDYFEMEADVTDYELSQGITVATNELFNNLETDKFDSFSELKDSMKLLQDSSNKLVDGSGELRNGLDTLLSGAKQLNDGVAKMQNQLAPGMSLFANAVQSLDAGLNNPLTAGQPGLKDSVTALNAVINHGTAETGGQSLTAIAQNTSLASQELAKELAGSTDVSAATNAIANGDGGTDTAIASLTALLENEALPDEVKATIQENIAALQKDKATRTATASAFSEQVKTQAQNTQKLVKNVVRGAVTTSAVVDKVAPNMAAIQAGTEKLAGGAHELNTGVSTLHSGIKTLNDGSAALIDGVKALDDGAAKLNDGMIQFNEEGIKKLVEVFDGDIDGLLDKLNTILDSSKQYKNFSGIANGMDGDVKFIFITE